MGKRHPVTLRGKMRAWGEFFATAWEICIKNTTDSLTVLRKFYLKGSDYYIRRGSSTLVTYVLIVLSLLGLFKLIPTGFLPESDMSFLLTNIIMKDGTSLSETSKLSAEIEQKF